MSSAKEYPVSRHNNSANAGGEEGIVKYSSRTEKVQV